MIRECFFGILAQSDQPVTMSLELSSIWDFVTKGGVMMIPIGVASLFALAIFIERLVCTRRSRVIPAGFDQRFNDALGADGANVDAAAKLCNSNPSPLSSVMLAALRRKDEPLQDLERHIEQAGQREVFKLRRNLRGLALVASVSPLMGLLGTIFGMIRAFQKVAGAGALGQTELLAQGIYEALITTAAGLLVAIPALIAYHYISSRIDIILAELDRIVCGFVDSHGRAMGRTRALGSAPGSPATAVKVASDLAPETPSSGLQPQQSGA